MLPVALINPPVNTLPLVVLPVTAKLVNVPTDVILVCAAVVNVPTMLVPDKLPAVILPVALINPVTYSPVVAYTATLPVPPTPMATLPPELTTRTLLVPFCIDVASMPVSKLPLPKIYPPDILAVVTTLLVAEINPVTYSPVVSYTATLLVPPTLMATLPPELTTRTLLVPFCIEVASMPVSKLPLPKK